jgi:hypothetical protein
MKEPGALSAPGSQFPALPADRYGTDGLLPVCRTGGDWLAPGGDGSDKFATSYRASDTDKLALYPGHTRDQGRPSTASKSCPDGIFRYDAQIADSRARVSSR